MTGYPALSRSSLFAALPADLRALLEASAERARYLSGDALFYQGDPAARLGLLIEGHVGLTAFGRPHGFASPGDILDAAAVFGGLPHTVTAQAQTDCLVWWWPAADFEADPALRAAARAWMGRALQTAETRLAELDAPLHLSSPGAVVTPGPFRFDGATLLLAFCEADPDPLIAALPPDVSLLRLPGSTRAPLLVGLADFPAAYPEADPAARFAYTETAFFIPVRLGATPGVFIPWIYPSAWEPILIGREVYGFPKQPGQTALTMESASLRLDGSESLRLNWESQSPSSEAALVGALMAWLGMERTLSGIAFLAGDALRAAAGLPAHRRVDVFNRKRVPAAGPGVESAGGALGWAVDQLTQAVFGVLRWEQIYRLENARLEIGGEPLAGLNVSLREAYRTRLDMRLSAGKVARDYLTPG